MKTQLEIVPEWRDALAEKGLNSFDAFMKVRGGEPVSRHRHRETIPLDIPFNGSTRRCYLKRVFGVPPKHAIWPLTRFQLGRSQPWREWHNIADLQAAGIPTMNRIAMGERRAWGRPASAFIVVEGVPESHTLAEWVVHGYPPPRTLAHAEYVQLLSQVIAIVGQLHGNGFIWPDIGAKHIFVNAPPGSFALRLIDLERVRHFSSPPGRIFRHRIRVRDLQRLFSSLQPISLTKDVLGELHTRYQESVAAASRLTDREYMPEFAFPQTTTTVLPRMAAGFVHPDHRPMAPVKDCFIDPELRGLFERERLNSMDAFFHYSSGEFLGKPGLKSHRSRIRIQVQSNGTMRTFYLKRYARPPWGEQWKRICESCPRHSTAWREAHFAKVLSRIGIPTMRCVAWGEEMGGRREVRSFIVTEAVAGTSLEKIVRQMGEGVGLSARDRHEVVRQLALITRRMHLSKLFHRDYYLSHIFVTRNGDGAIVLRLIDLARMIENPRMPHRWAIKDLAALAYSSPKAVVTRADRIRFLLGIMGIAKLESPHPRVHRHNLRQLIGKIEARVARMARHDANRRRRLNLEAAP